MTTTRVLRMYSHESIITTEPSIRDVIQTRPVSPLARARNQSSFSTLDRTARASDPGRLPPAPHRAHLRRGQSPHALATGLAGCTHFALAMSHTRASRCAASTRPQSVCSSSSRAIARASTVADSTHGRGAFTRVTAEAPRARVARARTVVVVIVTVVVVVVVVVIIIASAQRVPRRRFRRSRPLPLETRGRGGTLDRSALIIETRTEDLFFNRHRLVFPTHSHVFSSDETPYRGIGESDARNPPATRAPRGRDLARVAARPASFRRSRARWRPNKCVSTRRDGCETRGRARGRDGWRRWTSRGARRRRMGRRMVEARG